MAGHVRLILTLHNHQPIGNFDGVCEGAYRDSYAPFLHVLDEFPEIKVVLHNSGSLFEWLATAHPEYLDRLRTIVQRGQVELLGGPLYEPILACIPRRDRIGQIQAYKRLLERTFGTTVRGMWVPERVWEQSFASDLVEAWIEYTLLDDTHFRNAGLSDDELHGYYLTENDGKVLKVFAGSERLRYLIPYAQPHEIIQHCRWVADHHPHAVLVFGDDGEKFGVWPGSQEHVYRDGWLRRFFQTLRENQDWLQVTTMAESVDHVSPLGRQYLPDASYREMTEWALPAEKQLHYKQLQQGLEHLGEWPRIKQFWRAGFWRNFLVKYPEANEMYCRMLQVSERIEALLHEPGSRERATAIAEARRELYRAQCNCPYWHGAFGGLYLPHLRNAIYSRLIHAETLLDHASNRTGTWVHAEAVDLNCDARKELRLDSDRLMAFIAPAQGGQLYELDVRAIQTNLLATLNRRFEPYHDKIRQHAGQAVTGHGGGVDPNGAICFKQPGLDQKLAYDRWPRKSLVDHFLQPGLTFDTFADGAGHVGDFAQGVYQAKLRRSRQRVETELVRDGKLGPYTVRVGKTVALSSLASGTLEIHYALENLPAELPIHFGVEFNFAAMPGGAPDRYFYDHRGRQLGTLDRRQALERCTRLGLVDEWLGIDVNLEWSQTGGVWAHPVETVSQSEAGFEAVHQSVAVMPHWEFIAPEDGRWSVTITLTIDTSAAQAKQLLLAPVRQTLAATAH